MEKEYEYIDESHKDFKSNWVSSSWLIWALTIFGFVAFMIGCSFNLYQNRYKGKPDVAVPENTQYSPKYK